MPTFLFRPSVTSRPSYFSIEKPKPPMKACVSDSAEWAYPFFLTIEFVGSRKCSLLHQMKNLLRVDDLFSTVIKLYIGTKKFLNQHGNIKFQNVEAG